VTKRYEPPASSDPKQPDYTYVPPEVEAAANLERQRLYWAAVRKNNSAKASATVLDTKALRLAARRERKSREFFGVSYEDLKAAVREAFNLWGTK
jgi:hypothetical protein